MAVKASAVDRVEDLSKYESVEHESLDDQIALVGILNTKNLKAAEMKDEDDDDLDDLINGLHENHAVHLGTERGGAVFSSGLRSRSFLVAGSVARTKAANVSMMILIQRS